MRVLISGGAGFIGQHLAAAITARGHQAIALDLLNPQVHLDPDIARRRFPGQVVVGDVCDESVWRQLGPLDAIVHLAAETGTGQSMYEAERYHRVNVDGSRVAARAAARAGVPLIAISSRAVYGEGARVEADGARSFDGIMRPGSEAAASREDDPHAPVSVYGKTKSIGEQAIAGDVPPDASVTIIRPQNVIGAGQALHNPYTGVLAAFLACLKEQRPISVYGDGSQTRDFVHVTDLVELIVWSTDNPPHGTRILNCGSGIRTSLREIAQYAVAASPTGAVPIQHVDVHRAGDIRDACADLTRVRQAGAPTPRWSTADAVADFVRSSWTERGADSRAWDVALNELRDRGLTS